MFCHFILTRFNLATPGREERHRGKPGWLDRRIFLFEKYCLPSVEAQTNSNFRWLIYFDIRTPDEYRRYFENYARRQFIELRYVDGLTFSKQNVRKDILWLTPKNCVWIITTRLDNDDAIHRSFVDILQSAWEPRGRHVLNFTYGLILEEGKIYRVTDRSNAFATLVEPADDVHTVWARQHTDLKLLAPFKQLDSRPMWLQVIHKDNVSNRKRGNLVSDSSEEVVGFPIGEKDLVPVTPWALITHNVIAAPAKSILSSTKATVRAGFHVMEMATGWSATEALRRQREVSR